MKIYTLPFIIGVVLALFLLVTGLVGYSIVIYYAWPIILFVLLPIAFFTVNRRVPFQNLLDVPPLKRQSPFRIYLVALAILVVFSISGALAGHYGRRLYCLKVCGSCEPMIQLIQKYYTEHGVYPETLNSIQGFTLAQNESGLRIGQGRFSEYGLYLKGIESADVLFYLDTKDFVCVVPVTKILPMSFTRFYVYICSSHKPEWQYDKIVWYLGPIKNGEEE